MSVRFDPPRELAIMINGFGRGVLRVAPAIVLASLTCPLFFFSSRRRHTRLQGDWSSDVCSSDLLPETSRRRGLVGVARGFIRRAVRRLLLRPPGRRAAPFTSH